MGRLQPNASSAIALAAVLNHDTVTCAGVSVLVVGFVILHVQYNCIVLFFSLDNIQLWHSVITMLVTVPPEASEI